MPEILPMFPLQAVVFPGEQMRLHIFEPRYQQLIGECESAGITFGIPCYLPAGLAEIGTEMRLIKVFHRYPSGESDIQVEGVGVFRMRRFVKDVPGKLYSAGEIERLPEGDPDGGGRAHRKTLHKLFDALRDVLGLPPSTTPPDAPNLAFALAPEMGLRVEQKLQLLALEDEADRQAYLIAHLEEVIPVLEAAEETRRRVQGNGHFHKFPELEL
jgi:ATP-dependent Lon protease